MFAEIAKWGAWMEKRSIGLVFNGCPESLMDTTSIKDYLVENGWLIRRKWKDADLIIFYACGLTQKMVQDSLEIVREIQHKKKESQDLLVLGCLTKINPEVLKSVYNAPLLSDIETAAIRKITGLNQSMEHKSANNLQSHLRIIPSRALSQFMMDEVVLSWDNYLQSKFNLYKEKDNTVFYIKVVNGCKGNCTYCSIRRSRGSTKSKPIEMVIDELKDGLRRGFNKFSLMGTDLGSYGVDLGYNLIDLLKRILEIEGNFTISLRNVNPRYLKQMLSEFTEILKTGKVAYVELPVESGSDRILNLMNRGYTIEEYKNCLNAIRRAYPDIVIRTQLIVGFPTETNEDFNESIHLLDTVEFDYVEVYEYSGDKETPSEKIEGKVTERTKRQRYLKLRRKAILNRSPRKIKRMLVEAI